MCRVWRGSTADAKRWRMYRADLEDEGEEPRLRPEVRGEGVRLMFDRVELCARAPSAERCRRGPRELD